MIFLIAAYDSGYDGLIKGSQFITRLQMTGRLRDYFIFMIAFMILILGYTMVQFDAFSINTTNLSPIQPYMWILSIIFIGSVIAVPFISQPNYSHHRSGCNRIFSVTDVCSFPCTRFSTDAATR